MHRENHLDKRTVKARASAELEYLEPLAKSGLEGLPIRFKMARIRAGLSQLRVSLAMRSIGFPWDKKRVWSIERGMSSPTVRELYAVASVLKCNVIWLFGGE